MRKIPYWAWVVAALTTCFGAWQFYDGFNGLSGKTVWARGFPASGGDAKLAAVGFFIYGILSLGFALGVLFFSWKRTE